MNGIELKGVTKRYGEVTALNNVTLSLGENRIYGLLGRNGAGKTTLLNAVTNRIFVDNGEILVNGERAAENDRVQALIYMMSEQRCYPEGMRVENVFKWTSTLHDGAFDMELAHKLCDAFGLNPKKRVKQLSTGYGSIYKLITSMALKVPFLLLDEPVLGLDANHRELLYKLLLENYTAYPRTIVISTHLIEEVSALIEEVIIIKGGQIIAQEASESLLSKGYTVSGPTAAVDAYAQGREIIGTDNLGGLKTVYILGAPEREKLTEGLELSRMDLQKLFIQLTNN